MAMYIDPVTGEISYNSYNNKRDASTNGAYKGLNTTSTARSAQQATQNASASKVEEQIVEYCEGVIGLLPNPKFRAKKIYKVKGVGDVFSGNYYFKKVRHTISTDTYTVEADVAKLTQAVFTSKTDDKDNPTSPTSPSNPNYTMYKIVSGDTLWGIAKKFYGNGALWEKIYQVNKDTVKDPDLIYPGNWLKIPK